MRFQEYDYSCGPACIVNCLRVLGRFVSERKVRRYSNSDREFGTNDIDLMRALHKLRVNYTKHEQSQWSKAYRWLINKLESGSPVILCVNNWHHYVSAISLVGNKIVIFDPANWGRSKKENGIHILTKQELKKIWYNKKEHLFSGISISKK